MSKFIYNPMSQLIYTPGEYDDITPEMLQGNKDVLQGGVVNFFNPNPINSNSTISLHSPQNSGFFASNVPRIGSPFPSTYQSPTSIRNDNTYAALMEGIGAARSTNQDLGRNVASVLAFSPPPLQSSSPSQVTFGGHAISDYQIGNLVSGYNSRNSALSPHRPRNAFGHSEPIAMQGLAAELFNRSPGLEKEIRHPYHYASSSNPKEQVAENFIALQNPNNMRDIQSAFERNNLSVGVGSELPFCSSRDPSCSSFLGQILPKPEGERVGRLGMHLGSRYNPDMSPGDWGNAAIKEFRSVPANSSASYSYPNTSKRILPHPFVEGLTDYGRLPQSPPSPSAAYASPAPPPFSSSSPSSASSSSTPWPPPMDPPGSVRRFRSGGKVKSPTKLPSVGNLYHCGCG